MGIKANFVFNNTFMLIFSANTALAKLTLIIVAITATLEIILANLVKAASKTVRLSV